MNCRITAGLFLLALCSCSKQPTTVVATPQTETESPVVIDQAVIDAYAKAQAEANATVKHSAAGEALLKHGYSFVKLTRDGSSKLNMNCLANGHKICLNIDTGSTFTVIADQ